MTAMSTISKRDRMLLMILAGIVVFIGLYLGVYNRFVSMRDTVLAEIDEMTPRLETLREYAANQAKYQAEIEAAKTVIDTLRAEFPREVRPEDLIMLSTQLEDDVGMTIGTVSFAKPVAVLEFNNVVEKEAGSYQTAPVTAWNKAMSLSCTLTYPQLKETVRYLYSLPLATTLEAVSVSYDSSTGELFGSMSVNKYYMTGIDDAYQETQIPPVSQGTPNIFGSITTE
ncbi:MAG TPA: hypothetical protein VN446_04730 [Candidatus Acidoferrum sp.]|nr:hypothetical protein [Candidatus Acidoferrum sp.]